MANKFDLLTSQFAMDHRLRRLRLAARRLLTGRKRLLVCCVVSLCALWLLRANVEKLWKSRRRVDFYVVEEHHEVMRYWVHETVIKNLNRSKNTLIHIDAHSDMAPPFLVPSFPRFRWPKDEDQVSIMMQRNDMFIQSAVIIGLIDHIIWITPSWDKDLQEEGHQKFKLEVGYRLDTRNSTHTKQFCECHVQYDEQERRSKARECSYTEMSGPKAGEDIPLDTELCRRARSVKMEVVGEESAIELLESVDWADSQRPVMLDIDEDYFGCQSGYDGLKKAKLSTMLFMELNEQINNLICPNHAREEDCADKMLKDYLAEYIKLCELTTAGQHCQKDTEHLRMVLDKHIMSGFDEVHTMFCTDTGVEAMTLMANVLSMLNKMNLEQLQALLEIGFCMRTSPATVGFEDQRPYGACSGANLPNETVVTLYTPGPSEHSHRVNQFYQILDRIMEFDLKVLTLCRSVRDGYTPRLMANSIEDSILQYFHQDKVSDKWDFNIIFDANLLGDKAGWAGRHKPG